jgi:hypothetical protein
VLALLSAAIGVAVATNWRPAPFLALAIVLNVGYWVVGQGFGGIFYTNSATDPNAGPLFILLALVVLSLTPRPSVVRRAADVNASNDRARAAVPPGRLAADRVSAAYRQHDDNPPPEG